MNKEDVVCMHTHTTEYCSAIINNGIIPFVATEMNLEIIILSEVSSDF